MLRPKAGFVVFGVHKDGLVAPLGMPFVYDALVARARAALRRAGGFGLIEHDVILSTKAEARACLDVLRKRDDLDALVLFSSTWAWVAHLIGPLREFAKTSKGIILWTHPGSQGWRPVAGLVTHGGLNFAN